MSVYELQHVNIDPLEHQGTVIGYTITSHPGYYIHLPEHDPLVYKTAVVLRAAYDFSTVQIVAEADLPEGAEILGGDDQPETI